MTEWVSVKDEIPDVDPEFEYSEILIVTDGKEIGLGKYYEEDDGLSYWSNSYYIGTQVDYDNVTHFMELPKPPTEQANDPLPN